MHQRKAIFAPISAALVAKCEAAINLNDRGHQFDHILDVAEAGVILAEKYELDKNLFLLAALFHDLFAAFDRENHHTLGAEYARVTLPKWGVSAIDTEIVVGMCENHRSSKSSCVRLTTYERMFQLADRGLPSEATCRRHVQRAVYYSDGLGLDRESGMLRAMNHLKDKFGSGGYVQASDVSDFDVSKYYENLTLDDVRQIMADVA